MLGRRWSSFPWPLVVCTAPRHTCHHFIIDHLYMGNTWNNLFSTYGRRTAHTIPIHANYKLTWSWRSLVFPCRYIAIVQHWRLITLLSVCADHIFPRRGLSLLITMCPFHRFCPGLLVRLAFAGPIPVKCHPIHTTHSDVFECMLAARFHVSSVAYVIWAYGGVFTTNADKSTILHYGCRECYVWK